MHPAKVVFDVPSSIKSDRTHFRATVAALTRSRSADDPELQEARRNLRAARLADEIQRAIAGAPPLHQEQIDRLAVLLRGGANDAA